MEEISLYYSMKEVLLYYSFPFVRVGDKIKVIEGYTIKNGDLFF